jgi:hypothetical protein
VRGVAVDVDIESPLADADSAERPETGAAGEGGTDELFFEESSDIVRAPDGLPSTTAKG